jgi:hypothetical protein
VGPKALRMRCFGRSSPLMRCSPQMLVSMLPLATRVTIGLRSWQVRSGGGEGGGGPADGMAEQAFGVSGRLPSVAPETRRMR